MDIVKSLKKERDHWLAKVRGIEAAIKYLAGEKPGKKAGRKAGRKVSEAARRKMRLAAKRRWKKIKTEQKPPRG